MSEELKDKSWKTLRSDYIIRRPWLTARRDTVKLPTGAVNDEYYVLEYPTWINVIAITPDGKFVLVRQFRYAAGKTCFELCAGVVEEGEEPLAAAKRELMEETGYAGGEWQELMVISPNPSTNTNYCHCFVARGVEKAGCQHLDATEDIDVFLRTKEEVRTMLRQGDFLQALMVAPLWRYFAEEDI